MKLLVLVPVKPNINFVRYKNFFFALTGLLMLGSAIFAGVHGFNYGIDFQGGIMIEVKVPETTKLADVRQTLDALDLGEIALQEFGEPNDLLIRVQKQEGGEAEQQAAVAKVKNAMGPGVEYRRTEFVGPQVSQELLRDGIISVVIALGGIFAYVWFRFEWQFALAAILATLHDVIAAIGVYALSGLEFNLTSVAALLTIAGYSINDTVVVFDRVRENLRKYKTMPLPEVFNNSLNETLSRTAMTSLSTLLALIGLYVFGGKVLEGFSFVMIFGVAFGTYSSIAAVPLLLHLRINRGAIEREPKEDKASARP